MKYWQTMLAMLAAVSVSLALAEAQVADSQSSEAASRYHLQKEIQTDRERTAFYNGLQELESELSRRGHPIGTKEHAEAFAAYAHEFPLARLLPDVDQVLKLHAVVHTPETRLERYGYTKEQFLNPFKVERGTFDNGKFKGGDTGNVVRITAGSDTQGNSVVRTMSVPEFNEFKAAFMPKEVTDKGLLPIVPDKPPKSSVHPQP